MTNHALKMSLQLATRILDSFFALLPAEVVVGIAQRIGRLPPINKEMI
jgi:hypothetical protein